MYPLAQEFTMLAVGEAVPVGRQEVDGNSLYFLLRFAVNLNCSKT